LPFFVDGRERRWWKGILEQGKENKIRVRGLGGETLKVYDSIEESYTGKDDKLHAPPL
jgi:viroplasmin and RNaseH domain-containing protein